MKKRTSDAHEFSLYWPCSSQVTEKAGSSIILDDRDLAHRIVRVLRLQEGDTFILFDTDVHLKMEFLAARSKHSIELKLLSRKKNTVLWPEIIFYLPILKRDALEQAIYSLVEMGATEIRLLRTQKVQRKWGGKKELDRLHTIMISAAEQSKQYRISTLHEPQDFDDMVIDDHSSFFFFDMQGMELLPMMQTLHKGKPKYVSLMVGPEGDLTVAEKEILKERGVQFLRLTSTILRAQQAVAVAMGIFRSLLI